MQPDGRSASSSPPAIVRLQRCKGNVRCCCTNGAPTRTGVAAAQCRPARRSASSRHAVAGLSGMTTACCCCATGVITRAGAVTAQRGPVRCSASSWHACAQLNGTNTVCCCCSNGATTPAGVVAAQLGPARRSANSSLHPIARHSGIKIRMLLLYQRSLHTCRGGHCPARTRSS